MDDKEKLKLLNDLIEHYQELNSNFDKIYSLFGNADSKFTDSVWNAFESYMGTVQKLLDDHFDTIPWYIYDNKCGKNMLVHTVNGKKIKVKTTKQVLYLIENL